MNGLGVLLAAALGFASVLDFASAGATGPVVRATDSPVVVPRASPSPLPLSRKGEGWPGESRPFASIVFDYSPAPGQFVNHPAFNDPTKALGPPVGLGTIDGNDHDVVTLGGFGGSITLGFERTIWDDPANFLGLDAIVFGNAFWVDNNPNRRWAEAAQIEISRDVNGNGEPDDPWYLIPGSHILDPAAQYASQTWDDDTRDDAFPPANGAWIPPGSSGSWLTSAYLLPPAVFNVVVLPNPNGPSATIEGVFGYADLSPTAVLGDLDGDNLADDETLSPDRFYAAPDDPLAVGITPGSGGGDAFDIAWAIDPLTNQPADLEAFDFIRLTTAVNFVAGLVGEKSAEIDAVADAAPEHPGDVNGDGAVDLEDYAVFADCFAGPEFTVVGPPCVFVALDGDGDVDLRDFAALEAAFTGGR
jgi:hypothetical protein